MATIDMAVRGGKYQAIGSSRGEVIALLEAAGFEPVQPGSASWVSVDHALHAAVTWLPADAYGAVASHGVELRDEPHVLALLGRPCACGSDHMPR